MTERQLVAELRGVQAQLKQADDRGLGYATVYSLVRKEQRVLEQLAVVDLPPVVPAACHPLLPCCAQGQLDVAHGGSANDFETRCWGQIGMSECELDSSSHLCKGHAMGKYRWPSEVSGG